MDEFTAHLSGGRELTHAELVARRAERAVRSSADAPASLGPMFALPPLRALPRPLALMGAAQIAIAEQMSDRAGAVGIGTTSYSRAGARRRRPGGRVLHDRTGGRGRHPVHQPVVELRARLRRCPCHDAGGPVSHAAVIARELAIPAVIGDMTAFRAAHDRHEGRRRSRQRDRRARRVASISLPGRISVKRIGVATTLAFLALASACADTRAVGDGSLASQRRPRLHPRSSALTHQGRDPRRRTR